MKTPKDVIDDLFLGWDIDGLGLVGKDVCAALDDAGYAIVPKEPPPVGWTAKNVEEWCKARFVRPDDFWNAVRMIAAKP